MEMRDMAHGAQEVDWQRLADIFTDISQSLKAMGLYEGFYLKEIELENLILREFNAALETYIYSQVASQAVRQEIQEILDQANRHG